jgi:hypothetical protein
MMADTPAEAKQMAESAKAPETNESAGKPDDKTAEKPTAPVNAQTKSVRPIVLNENFLINPAEPFETLDTQTAKAYYAEDKRDPGRKLYALICDPNIPVRMNVLDSIKGATLRGMLSLVSSGPVKWAPQRRKCMALIYERPLGGPVIKDGVKQLSHISEYDFPGFIFRPLIRAISELESRGYAHRAIHPSNLYFFDEAKEQIVLGDCLTAPPGFTQPVLYETIPNGMADPNGRSEGSANDDVYTLGSTIVFLLVDSHPTDRLSDDQVLAAKIEKGTFSLFCTNTRIPAPLLEPLRGILNDDSSLRWGVREIDGWLNGIKQANPQRKPTEKGDLPYEFMHYEHVSPRTIALAFSKNVPEAIAALKDGELVSWVRRILHNPSLSEAIAGIVDGRKPAGDDITASDEFIIAKVCILLDPSAPIRYKGMSFMPESIGMKYAMELLAKNDLNKITELVQSGLPEFWIAAQPGPPNSARLKFLHKLYNQAQSFLGINEYGFGIERCIYEFNDGIHCLSPLLRSDYVIDIENLLPALDEVANRIDPKHLPVDRHIASFVVTQHNQSIDPHLKALSSSRISTKLVGVLSVLALLQWRHKPGPLYGLVSWVGGLLGPVINTYHSRTTRREIEREVPRLVRKGNLLDLFDLIDNIERRQTDNTDFHEAKSQYNEAEHEIKEIESNSAARRRLYENKGQQFAAMSSMFIAMMIIMIFLVLETV